jgi:signal transduction histidine kinase
MGFPRGTRVRHGEGHRALFDGAFAPPAITRSIRRSGAIGAPGRLLVVTAAVCMTATVTIVAVPGIRFAYRQPSLHAALETAAALASLLAGYLVYGRLRRSAALDDLLLAAALLTLGGANLLYSTLPATLDTGPNAFGAWAAATGRVVGSGLLVAAAFAPFRRVRHVRRALLRVVVPPLGGIAFVGWMLADKFPDAVVLDATPEAAGRAHLAAHPGVLVFQLAAALLYGAAALGFMRRAERTGDELMWWLSVACTIGVFSRLNYTLYPSVDTQWVYTGDVFRLAFHLVVVIAAAREISLYWTTAAHAAVLEERRRIARDLHDGLAQELAYVRRNLADIADADPAAARASAAARRALAESRRAIAALTEPLDEPLDRALARIARAAAHRHGSTALLDVEHVELEREQREMMVRVATEAITNALRHSGSKWVRVALSNGSAVRLRVEDGGWGFDPGAVAEGYGLASMRERAESAGGHFRVTSEPGSGTLVEVTL